QPVEIKHPAKEAFDEGRYRDAILIYEGMLYAAERRSTKNADRIGYIHWLLGRSYSKLNEHDKALEHFFKCLGTKLEVEGKESLDVASASRWIGSSYDEKGEYDKALEHYQKALAIRLKQLGPEHPDVAMSYGIISEILALASKPDFVKAHEYNKKAEAIYKEKEGDNSSGMSSVYYYRGIIYYAQEDFPEAKESLLKALDFIESTPKPEPLMVARRHHELGRTEKALGDIKKAREHLEKALKIREDMLPAGHPDIKKTKTELDKLPKQEKKKAGLQPALQFAG
ncbi:MAG: tetratricopeptide repeat protein, partial [Verrucomicrobiota bacterium]|nr:tetratricopeptide repeat protein [Verrucomicrobiota bacterium]